ncbi:MAG: AAA family ATPase [Okeania sp. SIO3H1]|nr:AAA family ATPase [Okeania sp. SIO3H1]
MELVHAHIAKTPPTIPEFQVPTPLANIVLKLMAKNAEQRYQSALGLKYDLEKCRVEYLETGKIEPFVLGERDLCDRFLIPEKLYGREKEVQTLLNAFERVASPPTPLGKGGRAEMMLVTGYSGIGKTAVVNEVHKPITRQKGYFIKGKFDQFNRNIPFSAFVIAFRDLMGQLLGESDVQLQKWKGKILEAVGENGQVMIDVIPELQHIIGQQPPVPELSGNAAQNRFNLLFEKFIAVFTSIEHPLTLFLDDLQWVDSASLNLLKVLIGGSNRGYLLLLGAYRDNEVFPAHPLMLTLGELEKQQTTISTITLAPLSVAHINQLVAETLSCAVELATPLTDLVYQKTKGNPFFTTQFLKGLYEDELITFNQNLGYWECDLVKVRDAALTDDVVEFMASRLHKLPSETQNVLKLAACIGNQFDLETLAIICKNPSEEVAANLWSALREGLILPQSEAYKFFQGWEKDEEKAEGSAVGYSFLHDRVQQAAYSLITSDRKQITHLEIGKLLLKNSSQAEQNQNVFTIVNQLNIAIDAFVSTSEKLQLARLNLIAGKKAITATAYASASEYLSQSLRLLPADCWTSQYNLTLDCYINAIESEYPNANFKRASALAEIVLNNAHSLLDRVRIYEIKISMHVARLEMMAAVNLGLEVLNMLEVELVEIPPGQSEVEALIDLPEMQDPHHLATMRILMSLISSAYFADPPLMPKIIFTTMARSLEYGNSFHSAYGYVLYGLLLCGFLQAQDIELGYRYGKVALKLLDKFVAKEIKARMLLVFNGNIRHWKEHTKTTINPLQDAIQIGLEVGDIEYAGYASSCCSNQNLAIGEPLDSLERKRETYLNLAINLQQEYTIQEHSMGLQVVKNLLGQNDCPYLLTGLVFDEAKMLPIFLESPNAALLFSIYLAKGRLCYLFHQFNEALDHLERAAEYMEAVVGMITVGEQNFYHSLATLAALPDELKQRDCAISQVAKNQKIMQYWASQAPENYQHKYDIIEAERYRVLGKNLEAMELYDRAIAGAKENEYIQEEALANELFAKFYLDWGKEKYAALHMQEAYYCYAQWGTKAKTQDLEQRYRQLLTPILQRSTTELTAKSTFTKGNTNTTNITDGVGILDFATLMKASRSLSRDIETERVIANLMQIILENAGAETATLMLFNNGILRLEAQVINGKIDQKDSIPVEETNQVPLEIVNTVKRTQIPLILDDARQETRYQRDPYIQDHQSLSLLCLPLQDRGKLRGILYLENNQSTGTFTEERVEVLSLLCAQAAITLENARLYQESRKALELERELHKLQQTQIQLIQSEKMFSLGQMVAGVAHEINNPISFIHGNITHANTYMEEVLELLALYQSHYPQPHQDIEIAIEQMDLEFLRSDFEKLLKSMKNGSERIKNIVTSLRSFARLDESKFKRVDLHKGIESTLTVLQHRLQKQEKRAEIEIVKEYGKLPLVECYAGQLNQVFLNILNNAIDALEECEGQDGLSIRISTETDGKQVKITIADNGVGMSEQTQKQLFDPFFTTKEVGKGTGLGLAIAYQIVTEKHGGMISCDSTVGQGTIFTLVIPR